MKLTKIETEEIQGIQQKLLDLGKKATSDQQRLELETEEAWQLKQRSEKNKSDELISFAEKLFA